MINFYKVGNWTCSLLFLHIFIIKILEPNIYIAIIEGLLVSMLLIYNTKEFYNMINYFKKSKRENND